ncbi:PAS domain S-box protein [Hymenobacter algoricola]|uniref:histidine kinase n=1 Tax=Hymenobacter algoricola TaxID=486267 RepID=A0ABP7NTF0_9BACT
MLTRQARETERQRLHALFMQAPAGIAIVAGPEFVFEFVNPGYQLLLPGRQLQGRPALEALPEFVGTTVELLLRGVYETGQSHEEQGLLIPIARPGDGELEDRYFTFLYQPRLDEQGQIDGVMVFVFEVTDQVTARQKVEESREQFQRFKFMADHARDAFILMREDASFAYLNQKAREAWGYAEEEIPALRVPDVDVLHQHEGFARLFAQAQHAPLPPLETRHRRKDGHVFPVEVGLTGLQLGGQPYLLAVARDVTAQQQATEALRESEARFRIMADAAPNQMWAVNPDSTIRYANQAFLDFVGVSLEQYVAVGWAAFLPPEELGLARQTLEQAIRTRTLYVLEHRMRRHDGEYRWLLAQGAPSFYPNGDLYGYVGSAIDITELKQTNERLTRTNKDLDNFVYAASHDLKQPVNNLIGLFDELRRGVTFAQPSEEQLLVPMMQEALLQLGVTIDDLATLGQAQQPQKAPAELVSLSDLTEEVVNTLEPQVRAARARITVDFDAQPSVAYARGNLRTILLNLLSNSLKYADPARPARIHVSAWVEDDQPVLVVADNGLGFDAAKYGSELFDLFRRLHHHTAGTGVGLYLVNRIVEAHGGSIQVESREGEGATFRVRLGRA